jgi:hypothetical protein
MDHEIEKKVDALLAESPMYTLHDPDGSDAEKGFPSTLWQYQPPEKAQSAVFGLRGKKVEDEYGNVVTFNDTRDGKIHITYYRSHSDRMISVFLSPNGTWQASVS